MILQYYIKNFNIFSIYKNGKYIIKNKYFDYSSIIDIDIIKIIYYVIYKLGNKYYADSDRISLLSKLCDLCDIEYDLYNNYIQILILTKENLNYKKDKYFEGPTAFSKNENIMTKIGRYTLFI